MHYDFETSRVYPRGLPARWLIQNTTELPNSAIGRVLTGGLGTARACTAALIGKRHILTASSCANWHSYTDDSPPDPMIFQPAYNWGRTYFSAPVIQTFWITKVSPSPWQTNNQQDWLIGILNRDMSATNGYFGQLQYNSSWNGVNLFDMTSYPSDLSWNSVAQTTQGPMAITSVQGQGNPSELYIMEGIVAALGDFGAPVYAIYNKTYRLIGVVGAQDCYPRKSEVWVQGGTGLWKLIADAFEAFP
jgi:hypothetical protein